jgi:O-antigen/teichoic acid export membrane protein
VATSAFSRRLLAWYRDVSSGLKIMKDRNQVRDAANEAGVRVFKNYSFLASSYTATRLLLFFSLVYIARHVGVQSFGQFNFAYALFMYATLLTHLGLMTFGTREVAREPGQIRHRVSHILSLRMVLTLASFLLLAVLTYLVHLESQLKLLILLFGLSLFPTAALMDWPFKGVERMNLAGLIEVLRTVPYVALVVFFVKTPAQVLRIPIFFLLSTTIAAVWGLAVVWRDYGSFRPRVDLIFWKRAMRESLPLGVGFMLLQIYYLTDTVVMGFLRGDSYVGWYSAAYKSVSFLLVLGGLFFETTFPIISRYYKDDREKLPAFISNSVRVTAFLVIPMAVGGMILAEPFLVNLYGAEYRQSAIAFQLLVWAVAIELVGMNWGYALMACDRAKEYLKAVGLGAVVSIALNLALIPRLGLAGAGFARLVSSILITLCFGLQFRRVSRVRWLQHLFKPAIASAAMAAAMIAIGHSWVLRMAVGIQIYAAVVALICPTERAQCSKIVSAFLSQSRAAKFSAHIHTDVLQVPDRVHESEVAEP